ncbi:hypothetical protein BGZ95_007234 [Linnemannia exigua]|uniref:Uncharacterized protein n=1 Tax=Linnemannia exigua TaxID=604196 RepID=A0AAD4DL74_9FUNG|nr:hypothetical protein BGZ95_007234 [Linnemannia exigua]
MQFSSILAILVIASLVVSAHAAPTASLSNVPPANKTRRPSFCKAYPADVQDCPHGNSPGTPKKIASDFLPIVDRYNHTAVSVSTDSQLNQDFGGNGTLLESENAVAKPVPPKDILPICVGYARNPSRIRLFRNRVTCTESIWDTLFIFTAHTKQDPYLTSKPMYVGISLDDLRSTLFPSSLTSGTYNSSKWKEDFYFYESANVTSSIPVWQTSPVVRTLMYPGYQAQHGEWKLIRNLATRTQFRPAVRLEMNQFKYEHGHHIEVHKRLHISAIPDANTLRCVTLMIEDSFQHLKANTSIASTYRAMTSVGYVINALHAKCTNLVLASSIALRRVVFGKLVSVEVNIDQNTYAAISIDPELIVFPFFARLALLESMRSGEPVMVSRNDKFGPEQGIVAHFQRTTFTMGGADIWLSLN